PCDLPLGALVSISIPATEQGGQSDVLACVVRCDQRGASWEIGCTFSAPLTDRELSCFGPGPAPSVPIEQRARERFTCQARANCRIVRGEETQQNWPASVLNVSAAGIALLSQTELHVGDLLSIELGREEKPVVTTLASVVRCTLETSGERVVGCNFIQELP